MNKGLFWLIIACMSLVFSVSVVAQDYDFDYDEDDKKTKYEKDIRRGNDYRDDDRKGQDDDRYYDDEGDDDYKDEDEGKWIVGRGKASTERGAITRAHKYALAKFLDDNMERGVFNSSKDRILAFIDKNWEKYCVSDIEDPRILKRYRRRQIEILVQINDSKLLADVKQFTVVAKEKIKGMHVAFLPEDYLRDSDKGDTKLDLDTMFRTLQDELNPHMRIVNMRAVREKLEAEARMLGQSASVDPESYYAKIFNQVQIKIFLWVRTEGRKDPLTGNYEWHAIFRCRGLHPQTAEEFWNFEMDSIRAGKFKAEFGPVKTGVLSHRQARSQAIQRVCQVSAKKIHHEIANLDIAPEGEYKLIFANFNEQDRQNIMHAISDLEAGKRRYCERIKGGGGFGSTQLEVRIKWLMSAHSQEKVIEIIKEYCEDNSVPVTCNKYTQGVIYFEPAKSGNGGFGDF